MARLDTAEFFQGVLQLECRRSVRSRLQPSCQFFPQVGGDIPGSGENTAVIFAQARIKQDRGLKQA
jgi:hypothetical protein